MRHERMIWRNQILKDEEGLAAKEGKDRSLSIKTGRQQFAGLFNCKGMTGKKFEKSREVNCIDKMSLD
ncbi:Hypothetical predicted protein [Marmota monax]|uniref:Uncharacterized protein n=1 Tax=Marmota monax TaxID=9995 RepID=A0A5E4C3W9_MARMO|nr:hypothetical protein GHT09_013915 [Marmota monax]VTJ76603.1 Hypothetical predicted protein [Marmota monax]